MKTRCEGENLACKLLQQSCINYRGYVSWTKGKGGMIMNCALKGPDKIRATGHLKVPFRDYLQTIAIQTSYL